MGKDLDTVYQACNACKVNSRSKNNVPMKRVEVIPSTMETGELICMDYGDYGRSNLLINKDRFFGLLRVFVTKDKTAEIDIRGVESWSHTYSLPLQSAIFYRVREIEMTMHFSRDGKCDYISRPTASLTRFVVIG